jgi:hypothetical protein
VPSGSANRLPGGSAQRLSARAAHRLPASAARRLPADSTALPRGACRRATLATSTRNTSAAVENRRD